jgi:molybdate transport system permease protein
VLFSAASRPRPALFTTGLALALILAVGFLLLPLIAILVDVGPARLTSSFSHQETLDALRVSLETTAIAIALIIAIGTPAAYLLATRSFPGRSLLIGLIARPVVLPPAVAGLGLLVAFGPDGLLGPALQSVPAASASASRSRARSHPPRRCCC